TVCVVGKMRDLILQLSKSSIYSTKPGSWCSEFFYYHLLHRWNRGTALALFHIWSNLVALDRKVTFQPGYQSRQSEYDILLIK
ncbi:hypothetical protein ACQF48_28085, partial [Klebsiella pneumoniae]